MPSKHSIPRVVISLGDPQGIGPEVTAKALSSPVIYRHVHPIVVGSAAALQRFPVHARTGSWRFIDIPVAGLKRLSPGRFSKTSGTASYQYIVRAVQLIKEGEADGLVTAPISKAALHLAGVRYPGHTELLAALTGTRDIAMMMAAGRLLTVMATRHLPLAGVGKQLSVKEIVTAALLAERSLREQFAVKRPRIAVCALNPHAGEGGLLGGEENRVIIPAVRQLAARGIDACGPLPGDSAWQKMVCGTFDLLVTMYHDQAMIGLKCLAPDRIVNVTLGLPFVRTSPGHGTGFDIAGKNCANPRPMIEAILLAARLAGNKRRA